MQGAPTGQDLCRASKRAWDCQAPPTLVGDEASRLRAAYLKVGCRTNQNKHEVGTGSVMRALPGPSPIWAT